LTKPRGRTVEDGILVQGDAKQHPGDQQNWRTFYEKIPQYIHDNAEALTSTQFTLIPTIQTTPFETIQSMQLIMHR